MYYGKFTHKSDVWGYGVTLWEIWTFGQLPYDDLTGREVLENIEKGQRLPQPSGCPDEVFKVGRSDDVDVDVGADLCISPIAFIISTWFLIRIE